MGSVFKTYSKLHLTKRRIVSLTSVYNIFFSEKQVQTKSHTVIHNYLKRFCNQFLSQQTEVQKLSSSQLCYDVSFHLRHMHFSCFLELWVMLLKVVCYLAVFVQNKSLQWIIVLEGSAWTPVGLTFLKGNRNFTQTRQRIWTAVEKQRQIKRWISADEVYT